jgi:cysteine-rich repeat protein
MRRLGLFGMYCGFAACLVRAAFGSVSGVVVSQVYGGGGNAGATYRNDFIELFNAGNSTVDVAGWSVQYAAATSGAWQVTVLSGSMAPGHYYLVQEAAGSGGAVDLPSPDSAGSISMSTTAGKVALVNNSVALSAACPASVSLIDLVGYGSSANCFEGSEPAPAPSNTTAVLRGGAGCTDTDGNAVDFAVGAPNPRNSGSAPNLCSPATSTPTVTLTATGTETATETASLTPTSTVPPSHTPTPSGTPTRAATATNTVTETPTDSPSPTASATATPTDTAADSPTATVTSTPSLTPTMAPTASATVTPSHTPTQSPTASGSATPTASATPACGNGYLDTGEQCDDGNAISGDACPAECSYSASRSLIRGDRTDALRDAAGCQVEWYVATSGMQVDPFGLPANHQVCDDQDPTCDFDPEPGRCGFNVVVCLNTDDANLPACSNTGVRSARVLPARLWLSEAERVAAVAGANEARIQDALTRLLDPQNPAAGYTNHLPLSASQKNFCTAPVRLDVSAEPGVHHGASAAQSIRILSYDGRAWRPQWKISSLRLECGRGKRPER